MTGKVDAATTAAFQANACPNPAGNAPRRHCLREHLPSSPLNPTTTSPYTHRSSFTVPFQDTSHPPSSTTCLLSRNHNHLPPLHPPPRSAHAGAVLASHPDLLRAVGLTGASATPAAGDRATTDSVASDILVLALPRGGLPVAMPVAERLRANIDLLLVRKLGYPAAEEVAMGAIAVGGTTYLSDDLAAQGVSQAQLRAVVARESDELRRRLRYYRPTAAAALPAVAGRTVVVVDDGIATGATLRAALAALRAATPPPRRLIVACPVAAPDALPAIRQLADHVIVPLAPARFRAVGQWYDSFPQTEDSEVLALLDRARTLGLLDSPVAAAPSAS
ncbi:hypothetical protein HK405_008093 [Cladochytrium tenue]|nr:hypothetical protein HK405_008093 [Cladochytrium tenue]